ncbi:DUF4935 domain-containing protein [Agrobacterium tumefaciens]|uniref:PIN-like domain-containing protein n=1 Tax=Agrobacterium tumefaciens TaxID=358 RepID=UPI00157353F0|nr:PIN-like domain-containing protein [Agrobacterium tumefaciens]NTE54164.1 DUF4935 domain-containing protein [Agrobacterium tumefaciens]NTE70329.1 DUF4935 domain-containing protein [Agrobacterium tumefaciens]
MTAPKTAKPPKPIDSEISGEQSNPFKLEGLFEDVTQIFKPNGVAKASSNDVLIAVDTNVLLLPYTIRKDGLPTLQQFYQDLRSANRLFLPARVAREFITNRDMKLAELLKMLGDVKSRINIGERKLSPILDGVEGSDEMATASLALTEAKKQYTAALEKVEARVQAWSGDDPVTTIYDAVFDAANIVAPTDSNEDMLTEWKVRLRERIPPGYKDGNKDDTGIGDFLIWKSLLALGATQKKDLIFVTGEEKADWFVRLNNRGAYPRPELVAEYRKHSGGRNIRLVEFHEVLSEMEVSQDVVKEVESAEITANNIIRASSSLVVEQQEVYTLQASAPLSSTAVADFRMRYGGQRILFISERAQFKFDVSEQGEDSLWAYPNGQDQMSNIPTGSIGQPIDTSSMVGANTAFSVKKGQLIWARNPAGYTLIARLIRTNTPEQNQPFEVTFSFSIFAPGGTVIVP